MIIFYCPQCETELKAGFEHTGKRVHCPHCGSIAKIPEVAVLLDDHIQYADVEALRRYKVA